MKILKLILVICIIPTTLLSAGYACLVYDNNVTDADISEQQIQTSMILGINLL
jgi:hypothetical protein